MNKNLNKKKKGSVLVFAIIVLSVMTVTVLGYAHITQMQITNSLNTKNSAVAFHTAEIGLEKILLEIYKNSNNLNTLNDLATKLGGTCDPVTASIKLPGKDFEFSFKERIIKSGEEKDEDVEDCNTVLADISYIKTVGKHSQVARAFYQELKSSLKRDLVAHWKFEDNIDALVYNINYPGSPTAKDSSDNNHILTLCPIDNGDHKLADGGVSGNEAFDYCYHYENTGSPAPDPAVLGDVSDPDDYSLDDSVWMDHGGAFDKSAHAMEENHGSAWGVQGSADGYKETSGIVDEYRGTPLEGALHGIRGQALYFNGRSNYLTMNTSKSTRTNYVKDEDDLKFGDALSISIWFKFEGDLSDGIDAFILGKYNDASNKGYKLYIKDSNKKVCVKLDTVNKCSDSFTLNDSNWHHVVITWDSTIADKHVDMYIDNSKQSPGSKVSPLHTDNSKFMIGGVYQRSDDTEPYLPVPYVFPHADLEEPFKGYLDDIRMYKRKLSSMEIERLYNRKI